MSACVRIDVYDFLVNRTKTQRSIAHQIKEVNRTAMRKIKEVNRTAMRSKTNRSSAQQIDEVKRTAQQTGQAHSNLTRAIAQQSNKVKRKANQRVQAHSDVAAVRPPPRPPVGAPNPCMMVWSGAWSREHRRAASICDSVGS